MSPPEHIEAVKKPSITCASCGAPLETLPKHDSRLVETDGGAERQDFCPACQASARAGDYHSRWMAQRPPAAPPPKRESRKAQAVRLREEFYRLADLPEKSDEDQEGLYLVAHLLMKAGGFRWKATDPEARQLTFEDLSTRQMVEVPVVSLQGERLQRAEERLKSLL